VSFETDQHKNNKAPGYSTSGRFIILFKIQVDGETQ